MDEKQLAAIVAALLGLLPILANAIINQVEKRSKAGRVDKAIDLAKRRIEFASQWFQARQQFDSQERINEVKVEMAKEFDEIKKYVESALALPLTSMEPEAKKRSRFQRLLLLYLPKSLNGWLYHTLFYIFFAIFILFTVLTIRDFNNFSEFDPVGTIISIVPFLLALLFGFLANALDRKLAKDGESDK